MPVTAFCLHALGASKAEFDLIADRMAPPLQVVGIDLPGFGAASTAPGTTVEDMVIAVEHEIGRHGATQWILVGHSMGGKIASIVASRTLDGTNGLFGLAGVVLMAASPLSPEPMEEARRRQMLDWARDGRISRDDAEAFVEANTAGPLPERIRDAAVASVENADPEAWRDWLLRGSREDWSGVFEPNPAPALILAGGGDGDLGPQAQRELNAPHWPLAEMRVVDGAAHLLPLEKPDEVAELLLDFWTRRLAFAPAVPRDVARVIASPRVSARTRGILATRALADEPDAPGRLLGPARLQTLRAVARIVVPQNGDRIDLAFRVDEQLARGVGDGWRVDGTLSDGEAYGAALDALASVGGDDLESALEAMRAGEFSDGALTAAQFQAWEEDASVDLVRAWLAHPASMASIDYDGFANGGDGVRKQGFQSLGAGSREGWEPEGASA